MTTRSRRGADAPAAIALTLGLSAPARDADRWRLC